MPTLEFATINLKPGVKPDDAKLVTVLHTCISEISKADGVSDMRFIKNVPQGAQEQILGLVGVWASVKAHSAYLASGKMTPLLMDLRDFITMRDVIHLSVGELSASETKLIESDLICAVFRVEAADHKKFEELVDEVLPSGCQAVAGWQVKKEESFQKAEQFGREKLGQEAKESARADADTWVVFVPRREQGAMKHIVERAGAVSKSVEVQNWAGI